MVRVDDSRYREVMGCTPRGRKVWEFRLPFFGDGQMMDGDRPDVFAWTRKFGPDRENLFFVTEECDWRKARKLAAKYAESQGLSLVEVKVPEGRKL